ncbi:hypothetical protein QR680_010100 [Steinernema hermaphroditum]|uniref:G-protein coupled receptors family 1 profile domain-containing protein n=1 Tax=Steinernema hermaphroditum TaxID=289476 RepID=A0AA39IMR4_9BILA|nr:hypothetical protein QR680_010100 [Steinernema hermaphroditum]
MSALSALIINWIVVLTCVSAIAINLKTVISIYLQKKKTEKHYTMLLSQIVFHFLYNISTAVFTLRNIFENTSTTCSDLYNYWTFSVVFSSSVIIVFGNIFIVLDRFLAVHTPIDYQMKYKKRLLHSALILLTLLLFATLGAYTLPCYTLPPDTSPNGSLVSTLNQVVLIVYMVKCAACVANVIATAGFVWRLRIFMDAQKGITMNANLKTANQVVLYQMLAETILVVIPSIITAILNYAFGVFVTNFVGQYPVALFSGYTTVCSVLLAAKLRKMKTTTAVNVFKK